MVTMRVPSVVNVIRNRAPTISLQKNITILRTKTPNIGNNLITETCDGDTCLGNFKY